MIGDIINEPKGEDIVVGIDFGTSGLGFAYGCINKPNEKPVLGFFDGQINNNKIPNEIILDDDLNVLAFGKGCAPFLSSNKRNKFHHFSKIKMNLYKKIYKIKARNSNKEVDIQCIIKLILKQVKEKAKEQIKRSIPDLKEENLYFTLTVPAIWDNKSKQIMMDAAKEAGLIRENDDPSNFFALEPEAALIDYFKSPYVYKPILDSEDAFILCDFGAGTIDIVTQKIDKNNLDLKFKEIIPPKGGDNGFNKINEYFMDEVIKELFGEEDFNNAKENICQNEYSDWLEFEKNIEEFKKDFYEPFDKGYTIDCDIFSQYCQKDLNTLIDNFNSKHKEWNLKIKRGWKIEFTYQIIKDLMLRLIDKIINEYISPILKSQNPNLIIFTGGGSANSYLKTYFQERGLNLINIVQSTAPEVAIALGSVLFFYNHNIISQRKSKYTFGIKSRRAWKEKYQKGGKKIFDELDDKFVCENIFSKFITKNENISPDREIVHSYSMSFSKVAVELYKTDEENVTFCDEKDKNGNLKVSKFAEFIIDVGNDFDISKREAIVKMKIGGTFINASAIYRKTGKNSKITCIYE